MPSELPWKPVEPSVRGRKSERNFAKQNNARLHPNSGAGKIKNDLSTEEAIIEYKNPTKTHTIKGEELEKLLDNAQRQGKDAHYIVYFEGTDITLHGTLRRGT